MSYEPTEWQNGDTITSAKLNNIEDGVSEVNNEYTPTNWKNGDVITADKLNNIEQGIVNAEGGGELIVQSGVLKLHNAHSTGEVAVYVLREADAAELELSGRLIMSMAIAVAADETRTLEGNTPMGVNTWACIEMGVENPFDEMVATQETLDNYDLQNFENVALFIKKKNTNNAPFDITLTWKETS